MNPIYTLENTTTAYQLNWSVALFGTSELPPSTGWLETLKASVVSDGVRILEVHLPRPNVIQFLASTRPSISPSEIIRSLKGRLQYLIRESNPKAFRRNYSITSVGEVNSAVLEKYVGNQTSKHPMMDANVQARIELMQFNAPNINLRSTRTGTYGQFLNSLQIVIENAQGWHEVRENVLLRLQPMILGCGRKKRWLISRIGILSNHLHLLVGLGVTESPASAALALMNNLAYCQGMKPIFRFSYYVGTFGNYDRNSIRRNV